MVSHQNCSIIQQFLHILSVNLLSELFNHSAILYIIYRHTVLSCFSVASNLSNIYLNMVSCVLFLVRLRLSFKINDNRLIVKIFLSIGVLLHRFNFEVRRLRKDIGLVEVLSTPVSGENIGVLTRRATPGVKEMLSRKWPPTIKERLELRTWTNTANPGIYALPPMEIITLTILSRP